MYTITTSVTAHTEVKKSRFEGIACPIDSVQAAKDFLLAHNDLSATHQCWAWKIGHEIRFNDAGEPSGTAGRPILAVIEGLELSNIIVLVSRWYGGIKLGTGGLIRAYGGCASQTLQQAERVILKHYETVRFTCDFSEWARLNHYLQQYQLQPIIVYQDHDVQITVKITADERIALAHYLQGLTRGRVSLSQ